jgi:hypothetical protein
MRMDRAIHAITASQRGRAVLLLWIAVLPWLAGCAVDELDTTYGRSSSTYFSTSVNGTDILASMFKQAGHEVSSRTVLITGSMDDVQTLVWFPDDYAAPRKEVCEWLNTWLADGEFRTLVYVGRGFDAAPKYWRAMSQRVGTDERRRYYARQLRASAQAEDRVRDAQSLAKREPKEFECAWFTTEPNLAGNKKDKIAGPWARGIDPAKADLQLSGPFKPAGRATALLRDDYSLYAWSAPANYRRDNGSKLIVVANGAFLLNEPLVNHEHRKLAGKLIETVGNNEPGRLVFLESGPGGPPVDPPGGGSALARLFGAWPLNVILLHLAVLGIIFCFARWPIFGRPKNPPAETTSDFGKHVDAVSELLRRTHDRGYALDHLPEDAEGAKAEASGAPARPAGA